MNIQDTTLIATADFYEILNKEANELDDLQEALRDANSRARAVNGFFTAYDDSDPRVMAGLGLAGISAIPAIWGRLKYIWNVGKAAHKGGLNPNIVKNLKSGGLLSLLGGMGVLAGGKLALDVPPKDVEVEIPDSPTFIPKIASSNDKTLWDYAWDDNHYPEIIPVGILKDTAVPLTIGGLTGLGAGALARLNNTVAPSVANKRMKYAALAVLAGALGIGATRGLYNLMED